MSEKTDNPAGGFTVLCLIEGADGPLTKNVIQDWGALRSIRGEIFFTKTLSGLLGFGPSAPNLFRLVGTSDFTVEQTIPMLVEISTLLANRLSVQHIEFHCAGKIGTLQKQENIKKPPDFVLH